MTKLLTDKTFELRLNGGNTCITDEEGRIVAFSNNEQAQDALIASPDMARALLMQATTNAHGKPCWCATPRNSDALHQTNCLEATAALRKAKVLP